VQFKAGVEPEFYILNGKNPHDNGKYFDTDKTMDAALKVKRQISKKLRGMGVEVEMKHHEVGPGQYEINFKYDRVERTAENVLLFKRIVRETAHENGVTACFAPKPFQGIAGNGMHVHFSAWEGKKNLFHGKNGLSRMALSFIAGLLDHAREITAVTNPTVNSYKRLVPGFETPTRICWGHMNRSTLVRIPASPGKGTHLEYRSQDPSAKPFLAFAVIAAAGMDGVEKDLIPPEPFVENVYENGNGMPVLPSDLREALDEMEKSRLVKKALGKHAFKEFLNLKREEWREYSRHVTSWEKQKYLTV
jgi:glutamine synthetase